MDIDKTFKTIDQVKLEIEQLYSAAYVTAMWLFEKIPGETKSYRRLIFSSIEFIPNYWKNTFGYPEEKIKIGKEYYYFVRVKASTVKEGFEWYNRIKEQVSLPMFWNKNAQIQFFDWDNQEKNSMVAIPPFPQFVVSNTSPIASSHWGTVRLHHLFLLKRSSCLEERIKNESVMTWINSRLMFNLNENMQYLGSVNMILPNPYYCRSICKLNRDENAQEFVTISLDKKVNDNQLKVIISEKINDELSNFREVPITNGQAYFPLCKIGDQTGYAIIDKKLGLIDYSDFAPFLRKLSFSINVIGSEQHINIVGGDQYIVTSKETIQQSCEDEQDANIKEIQLSHKNMLLKYGKYEKIKANNQYIFYKEPERAKNFVRNLINSAVSEIRIIDPYFGYNDIVNFLLARSNHDIKFRILTSSDYLRSRLKEDEENICIGEKCLQILEKLYKDQLLSNVFIEVMPGQMEFHDRFIIIDNREVWLSGTSLNSAGCRASTLIKLYNPEEVIEKIDEIQGTVENKPIKKWLEEHKTGSAKNQI